MGATPSLSSGFHPQTNGQTERANQDLEMALRCMVAQSPASWSSCLPWVEYARNSQPSSFPGKSPFWCVYGYQPPLFPSLNGTFSSPSALVFGWRCRRMWARANLLRSVTALLCPGQSSPVPGSELPGGTEGVALHPGPAAPGADRSWLSTRNILDSRMIREFHWQHPDQLAPATRRPGRPCLRRSPQPSGTPEN